MSNFIRDYTAVFDAKPGFSGIPEVSPSDVFQKRAQVKIVDVRRPDEFTGELGHIEGATLATLETDLPTVLATLPKEDHYVFVCRSGGRSGTATKLAESMGFTHCYNMAGGMIAWNAKNLPIEK